MIEKKTLHIPYQRLISPAHYKETDTGRVKEVKIVGIDGALKIEERPIMAKKFVDAVYSDAIEEKIVYSVVDSVTGEEHHFNSRAEAKEFLE